MLDPSSDTDSVSYQRVADVTKNMAFCKRWPTLIKYAASGKMIKKSMSTSTHPQHLKVSGDTSSKFPGCTASFTNEFLFTNHNSTENIPVYRLMYNTGEIVEGVQLPNIPKDTILKMYKDMVLLNTFDKILYESQRQGRISFYMTNYGEEGMHIGSAAALSSEDLVYAQYRECGVFLWRGSSVAQLINQCFGNHEDPGKGKQMPVHYGNRPLNLMTISSPLATQIPQAVGSAYSFKLLENNQKCVICYFGEGAASEGDSHAAFNFASTLGCPVIFFCRNNGFAISTPSDEQYNGDGIAGRGPGYGIDTIRVDGTDIFAVYDATKRAREYSIAKNKPVIIEAMSYRVGHHSTSDDSSAYREISEITKWTSEESPIQKLRLYLESKDMWDQNMENSWLSETKRLVLNTMKDAEKKTKPGWKEMFHDVYYDLPLHLQKQMKEMEEHLEKYGEHYPLSSFKTE